MVTRGAAGNTRIPRSKESTEAAPNLSDGYKKRAKWAKSEEFCPGAKPA